MVVDDTPSNLLLLVTLLHQLGFTTVEATTGEQAVALTKQQLPDLILMDIQMPGISGLEATQQIRALGHDCRTLPIIATTAHALNNERSAWLQSGISDLLIKPIQEHQLIDLLQRWLGENFPLAPEPQPQPKQLETHPSEEAWHSCPIDYDVGMHLAINKPELADKLLGLLLASLNTSKADIEAAIKTPNDSALLDAVHKLHGACRYCGALDLAQTTEALETQLKAGQQNLVAKTLEQLFYEIERLQDWYEREGSPNWHQEVWQIESKA